MPAPVNTDLSASNLIPGVYIQIQTAGGASIDNPNKRAIIVGMRQSSGAGAPDTPKLYTSQSDIETDHGAKSEVARVRRVPVAVWAGRVRGVGRGRQRAKRRHRGGR